jgi:hypothetical protein
VFDQLMPERLGIPEFEVARHIAYAYAFYTLALAFIHRVLLVAVSRYREVEASLNEKILKSLRLVARVVLLFVLYLILAKAMLGEGALYGIAKKLALMGSLLVAWRLIRDWRDEVTRAYLKFFPTGRLADLVRASQDRSHGLLIATQFRANPQSARLPVSPSARTAIEKSNGRARPESIARKPACRAD